MTTVSRHWSDISSYLESVGCPSLAELARQRQLDDNAFAKTPPAELLSHVPAPEKDQSMRELILLRGVATAKRGSVSIVVDADGVVRRVDGDLGSIGLTRASSVDDLFAGGSTVWDALVSDGATAPRELRSLPTPAGADLSWILSRHSTDGDYELRVVPDVKPKKEKRVRIRVKPRDADTSDPGESESRGPSPRSPRESRGAMQSPQSPTASRSDSPSPRGVVSRGKSQIFELGAQGRRVSPAHDPSIDSDESETSSDELVDIMEAMSAMRVARRETPAAHVVPDTMKSKGINPLLRFARQKAEKQSSLTHLSVISAMSGIVKHKVLSSSPVATVFQVSRDGATFAMKSTATRYCTPAEIEQMRSVALLVEHLHHHHIVRHCGHMFTASSCSSFMEMLGDGTLKSLIDRRDTAAMSTLELSAECAAQVRQVASALRYLHARDIVHRDVKTDNVLVSLRIDEPAVLKLTDFDDAVVLSDGATTPTKLAGNVGTPAFMAPEVVCPRHEPNVAMYDTRADIWSLGMLLFEVMTGHMPYADEDHFELSSIVKSGKRPNWPVSVTVDRRLFAIYRKGLTRANPDDRWSIGNIIERLDIFDAQVQNEL
eukprot:TRINITY_DN1109_c0_g1_i1.p1 TRINITY_DN1109_c0_g1~~TRINITY_DN1109_c0_g1_i1.p1  ORF type:complete len:638 (+),score=296.52 TRINITY_DN1109_c0_g1_i1:111-1916(+)